MYQRIQFTTKQTTKDPKENQQVGNNKSSRFQSNRLVKLQEQRINNSAKKIGIRLRLDIKFHKFADVTHTFQWQDDSGRRL